MENSIRIYKVNDDFLWLTRFNIEGTIKYFCKEYYVEKLSINSIKEMDYEDFVILRGRNFDNIFGMTYREYIDSLEYDYFYNNLRKADKESVEFVNLPIEVHL